MKLPQWILMSSLVLLCGCFDDIHVPSVTGDLRDIKVSATEVEVSEPVEVTLAIVYFLSTGSPTPSMETGGVRLAACFNSRPTETQFSCLGELTLPNNVTLLENSTSFYDVETIEVERGQELRVEHTFTFTSDVPQAIGVQAVLQNITSEPPRTDIVTEPKTVTFR